MTAEEIRSWSSKTHKFIAELSDNVWPTQVAAVLAVQQADVQMGQMLMLAEIAAQLAEANVLTRFELGLDDEEEDGKNVAGT